VETARLEKFAKNARRYLMENVEKKLIQVLAVYSDARRITPKQVKQLEEEIAETCGVKADKLTQKLDTALLLHIIEKVAYTWFNRFCALRFMDLHNYNRVKIVSPLPGRLQPEILEEAKAGHIDEQIVSDNNKRQRVLNLLTGKETHPDPQSEAYRILLISACNYYAKIMPFLFEYLDDWTELLLPDDLLSGNSILFATREAMDADNCKEVEVIGWLYQFYISEKKDAVQAGVKNGKKVQANEIPAVTQLFTPHWIVKYMVQNSLGRLWLNSKTSSKLKDKMEFYIEDSNNPENETGLLKIHNPEEIKFCDPCCGSGHILTYAFDLLYEIYSEEGYAPNAIPLLIITKNLFGIEIDERAATLAAFALTMKAREKNPAWFKQNISPQICLLKNIKLEQEEIENYMEHCGRDLFTCNMERMLYQFEFADTFGSLIIPYEQNIAELTTELEKKNFTDNLFLELIHKKVLQILKQADFLSSKYQVVVTNPPYLNKGMNDLLSNYLKDNYPDFKYDLFSAFVYRCSILGINKAHIGMMNPNVWMYLSSYEKLRQWIIKEKTLTNLVELPLTGFSGATVQICSYNFINTFCSAYKGAYIRLVNFKGAEEEMCEYTIRANKNPDCGYFYKISSSEFNKIPGSPIAYWVNDNIRQAFIKGTQIGKISAPRKGNTTTDNNRFIRFWLEVSREKCAFDFKSSIEIKQLGLKWVPYNKGGGYRKWYGFNEFLVNWFDNGKEIKEIPHSVIANEQYFFKPGLTWSTVTSKKFSIRKFGYGYIFDNGGCCIFGEDSILDNLLLFMNSIVFEKLYSDLNPTLNFQSGDVAKVPFIEPNVELLNLVPKLLFISKSDWDSYETSWDFTELPLLSYRQEGLTLQDSYNRLREKWIEMTLEMKAMEEENNRIFIEAYNLQEELTPEVPLKEITLTCNPYYRYGIDAPLLTNIYSSKDSHIIPISDKGIIRERYGNYKFDDKGNYKFPINEQLEKRLLADTMKDFISYAVGCMFGRYALDKPGLILANQGETIVDYLQQIPSPVFMPDKDNILPILEDDWFSDDLANRFNVFLKVCFGKDQFSLNHNFMEKALGKPLRTYFLKDFYVEHTKRYKKRPIYWLISSPQGSFNALIYVHRYTPDTLSLILNGYLKEYIFKLRARVKELQKQSENPNLSLREKMFIQKEINRRNGMLMELENWSNNEFYQLASQRIELDLDDGIKVNYLKFGNLLKPIP